MSTVESVHFIGGTAAVTYTDGRAAQMSSHTFDIEGLVQIADKVYINPNAVSLVAKESSTYFLFYMKSGVREQGDSYYVNKNLGDPSIPVTDDSSMFESKPEIFWKQITDGWYMYLFNIYSKEILTPGLVRITMMDGESYNVLEPEYITDRSDIDSYVVLQDKIVRVILEREDLEIVPINLKYLKNERPLLYWGLSVYKDIASMDPNRQLLLEDLTLPYSTVSGDKGHIKAIDILTVERDGPNLFYTMADGNMQLSIYRHYIDLGIMKQFFYQEGETLVNKSQIAHKENREGLVSITFKSGIRRTISSKEVKHYPYINVHNIEYVLVSEEFLYLQFSNKSLKVFEGASAIADKISRAEEFVSCPLLYVNRNKLCFIQNNTLYFDSSNTLPLTDMEIEILLKQLGGNN